MKKAIKTMAENEEEFKTIYMRDLKKAFAKNQSYQKTYQPEQSIENSEDSKSLKKQEFQMFKLKDKIFKSRQQKKKVEPKLKVAISLDEIIKPITYKNINDISYQPTGPSSEAIKTP